MSAHHMRDSMQIRLSGLPTAAQQSSRGDPHETDTLHRQHLPIGRVTIQASTPQTTIITQTRLVSKWRAEIIRKNQRAAVPARYGITIPLDGRPPNCPQSPPR